MLIAADRVWLGLDGKSDVVLPQFFVRFQNVFCISSHPFHFMLFVLIRVFEAFCPFVWRGALCPPHAYLSAMAPSAFDSCCSGQGMCSAIGFNGLKALAANSPHEDVCAVCKEEGDLLCCDFCPATHHLTCLDPPMLSLPSVRILLLQLQINSRPGSIIPEESAVLEENFGRLKPHPRRARLRYLICIALSLTPLSWLWDAFGLWRLSSVAIRCCRCIPNVSARYYNMARSGVRFCWLARVVSLRVAGILAVTVVC